jgi:hypothetical protein
MDLSVTAVPTRSTRRAATTHLLLATAALLGAAFFLWNAVRPAWTTPSSDFPNYYTAARLLEERQPLRHFYEWPWFQRQIARLGFGAQLGGYLPQTPLTMLPFLPVASMPPLAARRVWLIFNLAFLAAALYLISRITHFRFSAVWLIALCSYPALRSNVLLGQYYLLLLAMSSALAFCLVRGWDVGAGVISGCSAALKLYGAPFLLFFAAVRRNRAAGAMLLAILAATCVALLLFGWRDVEYFTRIILPRALSGETLDPYNPGNGSGATLFRRLLLVELELNPHPWLDSPALFTFIWTAFASSVIAIPALASGARAVPVAWWITATLLASPNTASYTFALLPLCAALVIAASPRRQWPLILAVNILIALPLWPAWRLLFPRFWLLLFAFLALGWPYMKRISTSRYAATALGILTLSTAAAFLNANPNPPGEPAIIQQGALYAGRPAPSSHGIFYESIGDERYELQVAQGNSFHVLRFPGNAFHPSVPDSGSPLYFDLPGPAGDRLASLDAGQIRLHRIPSSLPNFTDFAVSHSGNLLALASDNALCISSGASSRQVGLADHPRDLAFASDDQSVIYIAGPDGNTRIEQMALATGRVAVLAHSAGSLARPGLSSDGALLAYASRTTGHNWIVQVERRTDRAVARVSARGCNCYDPAWKPASDEIIYSTDCRRGVLLPRLMRIHAASLFQHLNQ